MRRRLKCWLFAQHEWSTWNSIRYLDEGVRQRRWCRYCDKEEWK